MPKDRRKRLKRVDADTPLIIVNNSHGGFTYSIPGSMDIVMREHGDTFEVSHGELKRMMSKGRKFFEKFDIIIQEIIPTDVDEDEEPTLEQVLKELRLDKAYNELLALDEDELDEEYDFIDLVIFEDFLKNASVEALTRVMEDRKSYVRKPLASYAANLYKEGNFSDFNKMKIIATKLGQNENDVQMYWKDIEQSANAV